MNQAELDAAIERANRIFSSRYKPSPDKPQELERRTASAEPCGNPIASLDAERRFGQPHARFFPFIGRKVRTPTGPGTLLQVFADRVTVVLDSQLPQCSFFSPKQIEPVSHELV